MKKRTCIFCLMALLILILDGKTALYGASEAIQLCIRTVIPSLFPYMVLTGLLTGVTMGSEIRMMRFPGRLCRIPAGSESLLFAGFLGGYPTGAQNVAQTYRQGYLTKEDAQRMVGFCSNAGPAFIFGLISQKFPQARIPFLLWGLHILSALITAVLLPGSRTTETTLSRKEDTTLSDAVKRSVIAMAVVCGWILLFRILAAFLELWVLWAFPQEVQVVFYCFLDLANGCCQLNTIGNEGLRFIVCAGALGFGGVCVAMQTSAVIGALKIRYYLLAKLIQGVISVLLAYVLQSFLYPPSERWSAPGVFSIFFGVFAVILCLIQYSNKKVLAFPAQMVYNFKKRRNEEFSCCSARK